ncbi:MAG: GNAT family N-acetyltransferase [Roseivirga sp.]|nr:GNAT family N-acetyltransferase [Roseivirga sp.]
MQLTEVKTKKDQKAFLDISRELYKNDSAWVCPLDKDIEATFDPKENIFHSHGEATRWILRDDQGKLIGRIAAFINENKADHEGKRMGGLGFFESINDRKTAHFLLDTAKDWLVQRGVEFILGPINFGENDNFWGLLVEGFTHPSYGMNYNHPYYREFFESYGFKTKMEQMTNHLDIRDGLSPRFVKIANYVLERRKNVTVKEFDMTKFDQFADDFMLIYNKAWSGHENFTPIKKEYVIETFKKIKPIHDPKLIQFAYVGGEPASFLMALPDVNQIFKHFNGKLNLWNKLRFVWYQKKKVISRIRVVVMGTSPQFQGLGLESVLTYKAFLGAMERGHYEEGELSWVGDFNDKMIAIHKGLGAVPGKKHITYSLEL